MLVERFTFYHRRSYVCKTGLGDVLIGADAAIAEYNGVTNTYHLHYTHGKGDKNDEGYVINDT